MSNRRGFFRNVLARGAGMAASPRTVVGGRAASDRASAGHSDPSPYRRQWRESVSFDRGAGHAQDFTVADSPAIKMAQAGVDRAEAVGKRARVEAIPNLEVDYISALENLKTSAVTLNALLLSGGLDPPSMMEDIEMPTMPH